MLERWLPVLVGVAVVGPILLVNEFIIWVGAFDGVLLDRPGCVSALVPPECHPVRWVGVVSLVSLLPGEGG